MRVDDSAGSNLFRARVEQFLDDTSKGRVSSQSTVPSALRKKSIATAAELSRTDPRSAAQYNSYRTAFTYSQDARYVRDLAGPISLASRLRAYA